MRRTDTFDRVCFLYASLLRISKGKTVKRTLLQKDVFLSSHIKKPPALRGQKKICELQRNRELNWKLLSIFSKRNIFVEFKTTIIFFKIHFGVLKECNTFESNSGSFFPSCCLQPTSSCFVSPKAISDRDLQTTLHSSMNYWFL